MPHRHEVSGPVLGIESSCDETAAAVLAVDGRVLAEAVLSQSAHARYGGVVPEIAARAHLENLDHLILAALQQAGTSLQRIDLIAATAGHLQLSSHPRSAGGSALGFVACLDRPVLRPPGA